MVGKIQWLSEGTRLDLAFDILTMSMKTKNAMIKDMRKLNKIVRKAKEGDSVVRFKRIGKMAEIKIIAMADASFKSMEEKVAPVEGRVIFLSNGINAAPLEWKARKIPQVCDSMKTPKIRTVDKVIVDAIYFARLIKEIYTGTTSMDQIPVATYKDSKATMDSIHSTIKVKNKNVWHVIQLIKDALERGEVNELKYVDTREMLADLLTKDLAMNTELQDAVKHGFFPREY